MLEIDLGSAFSIFGQATPPIAATRILRSFTIAEFTRVRDSKFTKFRLCSSAISSTDFFPRSSVAVVTTGMAPISLATILASLLAPRIWPERRLIAYLPKSSTTTTAGSVFLLAMRVAMLLTTIPTAITAIIASKSLNSLANWSRGFPSNGDMLTEHNCLGAYNLHLIWVFPKAFAMFIDVGTPHFVNVTIATPLSNIGLYRLFGKHV